MEHGAAGVRSLLGRPARGERWRSRGGGRPARGRSGGEGWSTPSSSSVGAVLRHGGWPGSMRRRGSRGGDCGGAARPSPLRIEEVGGRMQQRGSTTGAAPPRGLVFSAGRRAPPRRLPCSIRAAGEGTLRSPSSSSPTAELLVTRDGGREAGGRRRETTGGRRTTPFSIDGGDPSPTPSARVAMAHGPRRPGLRIPHPLPFLLPRRGGGGGHEAASLEREGGAGGSSSLRRRRSGEEAGPVRSIWSACPGSARFRPHLSRAPPQPASSLCGDGGEHGGPTDGGGPHTTSVYSGTLFLLWE
ncbi:unnamed protein product [Urochloa humidicola]